MPQQLNPLAFIGQSNVPPSKNEALRELQTKGTLQLLADKAAGQRSSASDLSSLKGVLAPKGLSPESIEQPGVLSTIRGQIGAGRGGSAAKDFTSAGIRIPKGSGPLLPGEFHTRELEPGHLLPQEAASKALPKLASTTGITSKGVKMTPEGFREVTKTDEQKAQSAGGHVQQQSDVVHKAVGEALTGAGKQFDRFEIVDETPTHYFVSLDGAAPIRMKKEFE